MGDRPPSSAESFHRSNPQRAHSSMGYPNPEPGPNPNLPRGRGRPPRGGAPSDHVPRRRGEQWGAAHRDGWNQNARQNREHFSPPHPSDNVDSSWNGTDPAQAEDDDDGGWGGGPIPQGYAGGRVPSPTKPQGFERDRQARLIATSKDGEISQPQDISSTQVSPPTSNARYRNDQATSPAVDSNNRRGRPPPHLQMTTSPLAQRSISHAFSAISQAEKSSSAPPTPRVVDATSVLPESAQPKQPQMEQASTYNGPNDGRPFLRHAGMRDANRIAVPPVRQWGKALPAETQGKYDDALPHVDEPSAQGVTDSRVKAPADKDIGTPGEVEWDKQGRLSEWASHVPPVPPEGLDPDVAHKQEDDRRTEPTLSRPNSAIEPPDPVTLTYSETDAAPTPALTPNRSPSPVEEPEEVHDPAVDGKKPKSKPPPINAVHANARPAPSSPVGTQTTGRGSQHRGRRHDKPKYGPGWWKRPPHPMYSPLFAGQRIFVQFPNPIRIDHLKDTMKLHFSKYGPVRAVFHYEQSGEFCEKAFVVFEDPASVAKVFADPRADKCQFRSGPHVAGTELDLIIKHSSASSLNRTIFIRLTGPRADQRARSASPLPFNQSQGGRDRLAPCHTAPLPERLILDAVPWRRRDGHIGYWVRARPPPQVYYRVLAKARAETGREPEEIGQIDLRRRVAEKDIIPKLCDYFAEICNIYPPTAKGQGWLVTVGGANDARHLMGELQQVPGFFVRWADEGDGCYPTDGPEAAPSSVADEPITPITRVRNEMEGRSSRPAPHSHDGNGTPLPPRLSMEMQRHALPAQPSPGHGIYPPPAANTVTSAPPDFGDNTTNNAILQPVPQSLMDIGYSPNHPHLRRVIFHTYRGRVLREDQSSGEPRYIDERAIFVGRLVKEAETVATLLRRFEKYGLINNIEYNPSVSMATYATARISFKDKDAAEKAIACENGQISFGSGIKVEVRKVLPSDVHTKEMYIDDAGRAISPSMVSQYSPKSIPITSTEAQPTNVPAPPPMPYNMGQSPYMPMFPPYPLNMYYPPPMAMQGSGALPAPIPTPMPANQMPNPNHSLPPSLQYPMLCAAWGIGYVPAGAPPMVPFYNPQQPIPHQTPPLTPGAPQPSFMAPPPPAPMPVPHQAPEPSPPSHPSTLDMPDGLSSRSKLNPVGFKEEGGMMKAIYDPEELKAYCEEAGLSPPPVNATSQDQVRAAAEDPLKLLPVSSGGHDPPDRRASVALSHQSSPLEPALRRSRSDRSLPSSRASSGRAFGQYHAHHPSPTRTVPVPIPFSPPSSGHPSAPPQTLAVDSSHAMASPHRPLLFDSVASAPPGGRFVHHQGSSAYRDRQDGVNWGNHQSMVPRSVQSSSSRRDDVQQGPAERPVSRDRSKWENMGF